LRVIPFRCEECESDAPCIHTERIVLDKENKMKHDLDEKRAAAWKHGYGESKKEFNQREEVYAEFLHNEDFEKWQPFVFVAKDSEKFRIGAIAAQREYMRALWILNRFTTYEGPDWFRLCDKIHENWRMLQLMIFSNNRRALWNDELNGEPELIK